MVCNQIVPGRPRRAAIYPALCCHFAHEESRGKLPGRPILFCNLLEPKDLRRRGGNEVFGIEHANLLKPGCIRRGAMFDTLLLAAPSARWQIPMKSLLSPQEPRVRASKRGRGDE